MNLPPQNLLMARSRSEFRRWLEEHGSTESEGGVVLLQPTMQVKNGDKVF